MEVNHQLQTDNQELKGEIVILKKRLLEAPKEFDSEPEPVVTGPDGGHPERHEADHSVDTEQSSNAVLQPVEEVNESVPISVPLLLEKELEVNTPATHNEWLQNSQWMVTVQ